MGLHGRTVEEMLVCIEDLGLKRANGPRRNLRARTVADNKRGSGHRRRAVCRIRFGGGG